MDAKWFASKLCAFLIARGTVGEDTAAHEQLNEAFREFFPTLESELSPTGGTTDEREARQARESRYGSP